MTSGSNTIIESVGVYLPENTVSTEELLNGCLHEVRFPLEQLTGIASRRVAGEGEFSIDLAKAAIADCLASSDYEPTDIDLLISCNISRLDSAEGVSCEPGTALKVKRHFGFENALVFDIANACAGMFTGLLVADALIRAGIVRRGLVFSGEYISHLSKTAQQEIEGYMDPRLACLTVGDAGAAVILQKSSDPEAGFLGIDMFTLGKYSSVCIAKPTDRAHGGATMLTDPMQAAALGLEPSARHAARLLQDSQLPLDAFAHIIPHQISAISINEGMSEIGKLFDVDVTSQVINNLAQRGNTASNTHFVALRDHILNHRIQNGDRALFCIAGSGISVGTALYRFDDLPERLRRHDTATRRVRHATPCLGRGSVSPPTPENVRVCIESVGIAQPHLGNGDPDTRDMAAQASAACLENSSYGPRDVELLLSAGMYRSGFLAEPAAATMVADDLEMNHDHDASDARKTLAFDLLNGAVGFLNACFVASGTIAAGKVRNAMIVAAECRHKSVNGPSAEWPIHPVGCAVMLAPANHAEAGFGRFLFRYFTEHIDAFSSCAVQQNGATFLECTRSRHWEDYLLQSARETVDELLEREGLTLAQIKVVVPPQISTRFVQRFADVLPVPKSKVVDVTQNGTDLYTSSIPLAMNRIRQRGITEKGDVGLLVCAGAGIQVGCVLYHF